MPPLCAWMKSCRVGLAQSGHRTASGPGPAWGCWRPSSTLCPALPERCVIGCMAMHQPSRALSWGYAHLSMGPFAAAAVQIATPLLLPGCSRALFLL